MSQGIILEQGKWYHPYLTMIELWLMKDRDLEGKFQLDGRILSADEVRRIAQDYEDRGYRALPTCDNCDDEGFCMGHPEAITFACETEAKVEVVGREEAA